MQIYHAKPNNILKPYIDRYWSWESQCRDDYNLPYLIPGTGLELFFHYGDPLIYSCNSASGEKTKNSHIICLRRTPYNIKPSGKIGFIAVRFRAGMFRHFCKIPTGELNDTFLDIESIWGRCGAEMADKVISSKTINNKIEIIESELIRLFQIHNKNDHSIDYAVQKIYSDNNKIQINEIAKELNISRRHFQRTFSRSIGMSPKSFQRNSRFQHILRKLILKKESNYLPEALNYGYFDQSHFIKDFQYFTNKTPSCFLKKDNFMSHFYNPPL